MLAHAQAYQRITGASSQASKLIPNPLKAQLVSSAAQPPPQPTTQNTKVREQALGVVSLTQRESTHTSPGWTLHTCTSSHPRGASGRPSSHMEGGSPSTDHFITQRWGSHSSGSSFRQEQSLPRESERTRSGSPRLNSIPGDSVRREKRQSWRLRSLKVLHTAIGLSLPLDVLSLPHVSPT